MCKTFVENFVAYFLTRVSYDALHIFHNVKPREPSTDIHLLSLKVSRLYPNYFLRS